MIIGLAQYQQKKSRKLRQNDGRKRETIYAPTISVFRHVQKYNNLLDQGKKKFIYVFDNQCSSNRINRFNYQVCLFNKEFISILKYTFTIKYITAYKKITSAYIEIYINAGFYNKRLQSV